jgi:adenylate cyclase
MLAAMHEVRFLRRRDGVEETLRRTVAHGTTLLAAAQQAGLPVARACDESMLCARCGLRIVEGADALSPESAEEAEAKRRNRVPAELRLACACVVNGPVCATAPYW